MWIRVVVLVVLLSPILVGTFIWSLTWFREHSKTKRQNEKLSSENEELRQIAEETQDSRDWDALFSTVEQRQYPNRKKDK